jgi:hypothetical protein
MSLKITKQDKGTASCVSISTIGIGTLVRHSDCLMLAIFIMQHQLPALLEEMVVIHVIRILPVFWEPGLNHCLKRTGFQIYHEPVRSASYLGEQATLWQRETFGPEKLELTGGLRKLRDEQLHNLHTSVRTYRLSNRGE